MVKNKINDAEKDGVTVTHFAEEIGVTPERLLAQFKDAGITIANVKENVSQEQKQKLLSYLQQHHGAKKDGSPDKIVLRRAKTSEIKLGRTHGAGKTVSVQVRKKRTYVKRPMSEEEAKIDESKQSFAEEAPAPEVITPVEAVVESSQKPEQHTQQADVMVAETVAVAEAPAVKEATATQVEEDSEAKLKRKERHRVETDDESLNDRHKKKKKLRDSTQVEDKNFESLLSRGADLSRVMRTDDDDYGDGHGRRGGKFRGGHHSKVKVQAFTRPTAPMIHEVEIPEFISIAELSSRMSVKAAEVLKVIMKMGVVVTINQPIDQDTAVLVVEEMGHKAKPVRSDAIEQELEKSLKIEGEGVTRPPVITIMGHVDHGKTTLLDYIRTTKVAASEAGGITQHIGAYHVQTPKGTITFLDTPGHAAFTAMRARGAKLTDIVILVVAADDGVMPQTIEAIEHSKAAGVPIVVAVNKMDKHGVEPDRVKQELSKHNLIAEDWGGDAMFVPISAKTGMGIDNLLDSVLVQAEVLDLKGVTDCPARGVVIESRLDRGRGAVMSVLVQQGTLNKGDIMLAGLEYGRIRAMFDEAGKQVQQAGPSIPVEILGLSGLAQAGDDFIVVPDEKRAREVAAFRQVRHREMKMARSAPKLEELMERMEAEKTTVTTLNLVIKADVLGSVEALRQALGELTNSEVKVNVISSGIGGINESDVNLAIASTAIIIAFNVRANTEARKLMEVNSVDVHYYNIIYDVINEVKKAISGVLKPEIHEKILGLAQVREVFRSTKTGTIAGCMVIEGNIKRNFPIRVLRDNVVVFEGALESLRRFKDDVSEVRNGMECGIAVKNYNDVKVGDQIEVFEKIEVKREI